MYIAIMGLLNDGGKISNDNDKATSLSPRGSITRDRGRGALQILSSMSLSPGTRSTIAS